jgi:hypothetical protein
VVSGGIGTLVVVAAVTGIWPALARIGPLHTLHPDDREVPPEAVLAPSASGGTSR